ncbi:MULTISPECIES: cupin domain-containing protein [Paenibacillus]|uniref:Cupin 2 conserved barrel domain protein n=2 Tax=Paenibacillus lactis TaxID=228574 RepID=G4HPC8_9BACL|nr:MULTISPECIES: cupin domain-containing protein [Paenibacillus]EHB48573.1 Cupin 2 conserved barrel domain protein [Paenibacillus lactis 154]MBP1896770.1 mannose-6-phosphate isomerase-like protein (cupin superfamily) [Paenibacillus lactis]MCM3497326.1 cupin domain-containing protein [Paenibacillus lactis]HAG00889.1 cupin domain-containing protein [Paenibacillus lactis]
MKIFRFDMDAGRPISVYGSQHLIMSKILMSQAAIPIHHIGCMHIGAGGVVGEHPASSDQLFIVVEGEGWVTANHGPRTKVIAGQAVLWKKGEWHESGSELGMTVIVVEGPLIEPDMPEADVYIG